MTFQQVTIEGLLSLQTKGGLLEFQGLNINLGTDGTDGCCYT